MSNRTVRSALAMALAFLACWGTACNRRPGTEPQAEPVANAPQSQQSGHTPTPVPKVPAPAQPKPGTGAPGLDLDSLAKEVTGDVGSVQRTSTQGKAGLVFVFEEFHTSRVGQLQIAVMLHRLREKHGLKAIGLEGTLQATRPLDGAWFHNAGGKALRDEREDAAVRMLGEGEISSPEFMALLFPDIEVHGIEVAAEANIEQADGNPLAFYLVSIAEKLVGPADLRKTSDLLAAAKALEDDKKSGEAQKKREEAFDHLLTAHPWLRDHHTPARKSSAPTSLATLRRQADGIKAKAGELGLTVPDKTRRQFDKYLAFLKARDDASDSMVSRTVALAKASAGKPVAMIIGAAHSERVTHLLREAGVSYALVRPEPLHPEYGEMPLAQFERKHHRQWARTSPGTLGKLLNAEAGGKHKPPALIETATAKSYASATLASILIARSAKAGKKLPDDVRAQLTDLPELRIDWGSFERDGTNVIFRMWLKGSDNTSEREVWARVGALAGERQARSLEAKLKQQIADLGGDGRQIPPRDPPPGTEPAKGEGPGDGVRKDVVVARTGPSELAVFAETKAAVTDVGRLGG